MFSKQLFAVVVLLGAMSVSATAQYSPDQVQCGKKCVKDNTGCSIKSTSPSDINSGDVTCLCNASAEGQQAAYDCTVKCGKGAQPPYSIDQLRGFCGK